MVYNVNFDNRQIADAFVGGFTLFPRADAYTSGPHPAGNRFVVVAFRPPADAEEAAHDAAALSDLRARFTSGEIARDLDHALCRCDLVLDRAKSERAA
jgi:hypothetical protein